MATRLFDTLVKRGYNFYTGVPDSVLSLEIDSLDNHEVIHRRAANEGTAVGYAIGHYLATGRVPVVYMQNSGLGNATNPLISLAHPDVYGIPVLLVIGFRGMPGGPADEPQHMAQGRATEPILDAISIPHCRVNSFDPLILNRALDQISRADSPHALLVAPGTSQKIDPVVADSSHFSRSQAIETLVRLLPSSRFISSTGFASRELDALQLRTGRPEREPFLVVGGMGHASAIADQYSCSIEENIGLSPTVCIDGDGSILMHLGAITSQGEGSENQSFLHVVIDNGLHESVGNQKLASKPAVLSGVLQALEHRVEKVESRDELESLVLQWIADNSRIMTIIVKVAPGTLPDLPRPLRQPQDRIRSFMS